MKLCRATVLAFGMTSAAFAQVPTGPEVLVTSSTSRELAVAVDPNTGRYLVAWSAGNVFARRFERDGTPLGAEFQVSDQTLGVVQVSAAANRDGTMLLAWDDFDAGQIDGRLYSRDGVARGQQFSIGESGGPLPYPRVTSVSGGGFVAVWMHGTGVRGGRIDSAGQRLGAEFEVASPAQPGNSYPSVAAGPDGSFIVVWADLQQPNSVTLLTRPYSADGQPGEAQVIAQRSAPAILYPQAAAIDDRGYVVVWNYGLERNARFIDPAGSPRGSEFRVGQSTVGYDLQAVAADEAGAFTITWTQGGDVIDKDAVAGRRYTSAPVPREDEFVIGTAVFPFFHSIYYRHASAVDTVGNFWTTWRDRFRGTLVRRYGGLLAEGAAVDTFPWPLSDGNGVLEPGEAVDMNTSWRNVNGASQTFSGTLGNIKGPAGAAYLITDPGADYGTVADGDVGACTDCYGVAVSAPAVRPALHWDATADEYIAPDALGQHKRWRLHVGDSFSDVPRSSPYYRFAETLLHTGVSGGCGGRSFCPQSATSREQMSALLLVSKEGSTYKAPNCGTLVFADVPASSPFCPFIEELARRGITGGCGGGNFCPGATVTREQMSVFVLRTLDPALDPAACGTPVFADVPASSPYCRWIEELARRGIATGCGGGNFCPAAPVAREQMAVFLTGAFGLRLY